MPAQSSSPLMKGESKPPLPRLVQYQFDARKKLVAHGCTPAPLLHKHQHEKQAENGLVPDGWIIYMLIQQASGVPVCYIDDGPKAEYWTLSASVRIDIRKVFRTAWEYARPLAL